MLHRFSALMAGIAVVATAALSGQTAAKTPRTADGQPDLQGVWNFSTITPLERPAEYAGKEYLTDAEALQASYQPTYGMQRLAVQTGIHIRNILVHSTVVLYNSMK